MLLPLQCRLNTNLLFGCVKLIGYLGSAVNVVSSNSCVVLSPRIRYLYFYHQYPQMSSYQLQI